MPRSDRSWGRTAVRLAFLTHRWAGIVACLFFAMWFASGLVMIYVPYPALPPADAWEGAEPIDWSRVVHPPAGAEARRITLEMRDGAPVWRIEDGEGDTRILSAATGIAPGAVDAPLAARVAARFGRASVERVERVTRDQWTVAGGFDRHRPLWKATLADVAGTQIYISDLTGQPVQRTTRGQRFWNWLGSVPHWIYPTVLRRDNQAWRQVVMWLSGPCIAVALTGMWIGILRMRIGRRRYRGGRVTPYHGWMVWHHVSGLLGGVMLTTWIVSGWLSVDPWHGFAGGVAPEAAMRAYAGQAGSPRALGRLRQIAQGARSVEWSGDAGLRRIAIDRASSHPRWLEQASLAPARPADPVGAAALLVPAGHVVRTETLIEPDFYWADAARLPLIRLRFDDAARTWLYIDPMSGALVRRQDRVRRAYRWVYSFLHTWDWPWLTARRPVWDLWMWLWSIAGLVLSISGVVLGWRRLRRPVARRR
ncbi:PepSY domain-containing protein [Sphingomonas sp. LC-1]|uniref:PepSY domain-containing protein n=1 Tax=Sphingomonas sp. LC-1 TaxID=3110957 RepID=UPI0021BA8734|nr:PepSY domain-containing protein [Sphingomonas sp. LC-1]